MVEGLLDFGCGFEVPLAHVFQRLVRENHTPTECVVWLVALHHRDVVVSAEFFHQQGEVQTRRTTTDAHDFHMDSLCNVDTHKPLVKTYIFEASSISTKGTTVNGGLTRRE